MSRDPQVRLRLSVALKLGVSPNVVDEMDFDDVLGIAQLCHEEAEAAKAVSGGGRGGKVVTRFKGA